MKIKWLWWKEQSSHNEMQQTVFVYCSNAGLWLWFIQIHSYKTSETAFKNALLRKCNLPIYNLFQINKNIKKLPSSKNNQIKQFQLCCFKKANLLKKNVYLSLIIKSHVQKLSKLLKKYLTNNFILQT